VGNRTLENHVIGIVWMDKKKIVINIVFGVIITILFGAIMAHELKQSDFPQHIAWAKQYGEIGYLNKIPHTLFAKLVVIIRALLPANILVRISTLAKQVYDLKSYEISAWLLMIFCYLATVFILLKRITREWINENIRIPYWVATAAVMVIMLVGPIFIFTYPERLYLGYFSPNPYHNPTYVLFRPFVIMTIYGVVDNLFAKWNWKQVGIMILMILCATLAKPSFTITFLPAIGLLIVLFNLKQFSKINWLYIILPVGLTSTIMLGSQYFINYSGYWGDQIILAPFKAILSYVPNVPLILLFGLLSILFPLLVSIFYWKKNSNKVSFQLVWLNFLVALVLGYVVGEKVNLGSNNFAWGIMIAVFLLFVEAIIIFGKEIYTNGLRKSFRSWKALTLSGVLILHLTCGIVYYLCCLTIATELVV
jgi:hypothetical protein